MARPNKRRARRDHLIAAAIPEFRAWCVDAFDALQSSVDGVSRELDHVKQSIAELQEAIAHRRALRKKRR